MGLHAVQFGNNWMKKILRTAKIGRVQFGSRRIFLNSIISKLDRHVVLLLVNYIMCIKPKTIQLLRKLSNYCFNLDRLKNMGLYGIIDR
jgi:hypothetical protein